MQFHLNGFRPGDPRIHDAAPQALAHGDALPPEVDVLIVGCGPAGLTLAAQLAAFPDIRTAIVEQKQGPLQLGQADGIACRTMEMFQAFGFAERVLKEACWINEVTFWKPDEQQPARIVRHGRVQDTEDGLSEFPHVVLNQARVHDFYLEFMRHSPSRLAAALRAPAARARGRPGCDRLSGDACAWSAATPRMQGEIETVRARYVVGCDGARSAVRRAIGRELVGDAANQAWGVMDVLARDRLPRHPPQGGRSSRRTAATCSSSRAKAATWCVCTWRWTSWPRTSASPAASISVEQLIAAAQRILQPYTLEVKEVAWWSVYEIGQRICDALRRSCRRMRRRRGCRACSSPATPATRTAPRPARA